METPGGFDHPYFKNSPNKLEVIAHRGGANEVPGETVFAFEYAIKLGVDVLEMDVHSTKDNKLVLMHNSTVEDTTESPKKKIRDFTLAEIQKLDAGYRWTKGDNKFPFRGKGIYVPELKEVFEKFPDTRMVIEIKQAIPSIVKPLADLIREFGMTEKVLIASFWDYPLKEFRKECPEVATSASTVELANFVFLTSLMPKLSKPPAFDAVQIGIRYGNIPIPFINKLSLKAARDLNIPIQAWTVNREDDMQKMIDAGVGGIITDEPCKLLNKLGRTVVCKTPEEIIAS